MNTPNNVKYLFRRIKLTESQREAVDEMMAGEGLCQCGAYLSPVCNKGFIIEPLSFRAKLEENQGTMKVVGFCQSCHAKMAALINELRGVKTT